MKKRSFLRTKILQDGNRKKLMLESTINKIEWFYFFRPIFFFGVGSRTGPGLPIGLRLFSKSGPGLNKDSGFLSCCGGLRKMSSRCFSSIPVSNKFPCYIASWIAAITYMRDEKYSCSIGFFLDLLNPFERFCCIWIHHDLNFAFISICSFFLSLTISYKMSSEFGSTSFGHFGAVW